MGKSFTSFCDVHGEVIHRYMPRKGMSDRVVCCKCRSEAVKKRRLKIKDMALESKGSKCQVCGYDRCKRALEFHHIDEDLKEFGIGHRGETRSWERTRNELDKCVLLCANCHREVHDGLIDISTLVKVSES